MITGIHHVSMKCENAEDFQRVKDFYCGILGLPVWREWPEGVMIDTGSGVIEIFRSGGGGVGQGVIRHFALAETQVDDTIEKIRQAGYEIIVEPKDVTIASTPAFPARIAFCIGPLGEQIELFQER